MIFKSGVKLFGLKSETLAAMIAVDGAYNDLGHDLVITSVRDGQHSRTSLHYVGYAFDCRIHGINPERLSELVQLIRESLTDEFDVILEKDHIHIEFQPKNMAV